MTTTDRPALEGALDLYFEALGAGDPGELPLADGVRYTENGQDLPLGKGLWVTAESAAPHRALMVADAERSQVAGWGLAREAGEDILLGVRLRILGAVISEVEALVVRPNELGHPGRPFPAVLRQQWPCFAETVAAADRPSREDLIAAANGYLTGVATNDADVMPVADDCVRIENGLQTVLNPDGAGFPQELGMSEGLRLGVREQIRRNTFAYIEDIRDRRCLAADTERGVILVGCFFDHPGQRRGQPPERFFTSPNSMMIFEVFKVVGGSIRHIEAIGTRFPYGMRPGWAGLEMG